MFQAWFSASCVEEEKNATFVLRTYASPPASQYHASEFNHSLLEPIRSAAIQRTLHAKTSSEPMKVHKLAVQRAMPEFSELLPKL